MGEVGADALEVAFTALVVVGQVAAQAFLYFVAMQGSLDVFVVEQQPLLEAGNRGHRHKAHLLLLVIAQPAIEGLG